MGLQFYLHVNIFIKKKTNINKDKRLYNASKDKGYFVQIFYERLEILNRN